MIFVRFLSPALGEVADAAEKYLAESNEVAGRFFDEMERAEALVSANPHIGRPAEHNTRRVTLRRFPYDIVYRLIGNEAVIFALAHHSRDPGYWADRL